MDDTNWKLVEERPNFGDKQVKSVSEIEMDRMYMRHHGLGTEIVIPIRKCYKEGWIKAKSIHDHEPITDNDIMIALIQDNSLADWGVIAYDNGLWNPTNWLERMEG